MSSNRWLVVALILSLGINLGLAGFFLGRASTFEIPAREVMNPMWGVSRILRDLPADRRDALRPHFRAHMRAARSQAGEIHRAQQDLRKALLAESFDAAALDSSLDRFREHLHASQTTSQSAFVTLIASLTPGERALLVARMQHSSDGRRPGGRRPRPSR